RRIRHGHGSSRGFPGFMDRREPLVFPEEITLGLTAPVGRTVATRTSEVHGTFESTPLPRLPGRVACLMRYRANAEMPPTELQHFGHEWHSIQTTCVIKTRQNFFPA